MADRNFGEPHRMDLASAMRSGAMRVRARELTAELDQIDAAAQPALIDRARGAAPARPRRQKAGARPNVAGHRAALVRTKLDNGWLRRDSPIGGMVRGHGSQGACDGCDAPIGINEIEIRPRFPDGTVLSFHRRCFTSWLAYVRRRRTAHTS